MLLRQLNQLSFGFQTFSMTVVADFLVENRFHAIVRLFTLFWFFLNFEVFYSLSFITPYSAVPFFDPHVNSANSLSRQRP